MNIPWNIVIIVVVVLVVVTTFSISGVLIYRNFKDIENKYTKLNTDLSNTNDVFNKKVYGINQTDAELKQFDKQFQAQYNTDKQGANTKFNQLTVTDETLKQFDTKFESQYNNDMKGANTKFNTLFTTDETLKQFDKQFQSQYNTDLSSTNTKLNNLFTTDENLRQFDKQFQSQYTTDMSNVNTKFANMLTMDETLQKGLTDTINRLDAMRKGITTDKLDVYGESSFLDSVTLKKGLQLSNGTSINNIDGRNTIYGNTTFGESVTINGSSMLSSMSNLITAETTFTKPLKTQNDSWFPFTDGKNYIRGDVVLNGKIVMEKADNGVMLERNNGSDINRYGIGQFSNNTMRMYTASNGPSSTLSLALAKSNNSFDDILQVKTDGTVNVKNHLTIGLSNNIMPQGWSGVQSKDVFAQGFLGVGNNGIASTWIRANGDVQVGSSLNITNRLTFKDPSMASVGNTSNNGDPYYFEKVVTGTDTNSLRLTINDNTNESFQIWGNSCALGNCAGSGAPQHNFVANGDAWHAGRMSASSIATNNNTANIDSMGNVNAISLSATSNITGLEFKTRNNSAFLNSSGIVYGSNAIQTGNNAAFMNKDGTIFGSKSVQAGNNAVLTSDGRIFGSSNLCIGSVCITSQDLQKIKTQAGI